MTGPEHFTRAEELIAHVNDLDRTGHLRPVELANVLAGAQVHATLALVATQAEARGLRWEQVLG